MSNPWGLNLGPYYPPNYKEQDMELHNELRANSKPLDPEIARALDENFFECMAEAPPPSKLDEHAKWFERTIAGVAWLAWHLSSAYADESGEKRQDAFESLVQSQVNLYRSVWQHAEKHAREDSPKEVVPMD